MKLFLPIIDNGGGSVKANWVVCMMTSFNGREIHIERISDSHADRACNKAASLFLASDCTDMLIIDTDILFSVKDVDRILAHDLPLICGIYPKKSDETEACLGTFDFIPVPDENGLTEVRWAGRGFMRIRREVFEAMKEENGGPALRFHNYGEGFWDFFASGPVEGNMTFLEAGKREWVSEDILFCLRAKLAGFATMVDSQIALGHEGGKIFRFRPEQVTRVDSNITNWKQIEGWFDFEDVYRKLAEAIPDNGSFAEIGCWLGRSVAAFADFARDAGKTIQIHAVDTFQGTAATAEQAAILAIHGGNVEKQFRANMVACGLNGELIVHAEDSVQCAEGLPRIFDAVFIDGDHNEEAVLADIVAWFPNVRCGGVIAGHDIDLQGVKNAVRRFFGNEFEIIGRCWWAKV